jgi:hypothetical protein
LAAAVIVREAARQALLNSIRLGRRAAARWKPGESPRAPATPAGWEVGPPGFVGVGATGAATGWWHAQIERHPDVHRLAGVPRELQWFDRFWNVPFTQADAERYADWFPRPEGGTAGEWTRTYFIDFWVPELLARAAPTARILVLLRDPLARFAALRNRSLAGGADAWDDRDALGAFHRGLYAQPVRHLLEVFPHEQVLILQEEACRRDPDAELARTLAFIGLAPAELAPSTVPVPPYPAPLPDFVQRTLVEAYTPDRELLADVAPELDLGLWQGPRGATAS